MYQNIQLGFLMGSYFLASVVVTMTMVYFTRPKPNDLAVKNATEPEKMSAFNTGRSNLHKKFTDFGIKRFFHAKNEQTPPTMLTGKKVNDNEPVKVKKTTLEDQQGNKNSDNKERLHSKKSPSKEKGPISKADSSLNNLQVQKKSKISETSLPASTQISSSTQGGLTTSVPMSQEKVVNANQSPETPGKVPTDQSQPSPSMALIQEKSANTGNSTPTAERSVTHTQVNSVSSTLTDEKKGALDQATSADQAKAVIVETQVKTSSPSIKIVNEKEGNIEMENKPKEVKSTDDFSELFTEEDDEENEVSRLANELGDLDTQNILGDSLDLIKQIKKSNN
jgi:hypothetical protein